MFRHMYMSSAGHDFEKRKKKKDQIHIVQDNNLLEYKPKVCTQIFIYVHIYMYIYMSIYVYIYE